MRSRGAIGVDIGTDSIKMVALEAVPGEALPRVVGVGAAISRGMRRGTVLSPEELAVSLKEAVEILEKSSALKVGDTYLGLGGAGLTCQRSKGLVAVSRADGEITKEDAARAVLASETNLNRLQNKEILHKVPVLYRVDNETATHDPIGLNGVKLEAETLFVTVFSQNLKNAIKVFEEAVVEMEEIIAAPLAASEAVLEKREKEAGVMLLDFGAATTSVTLFEEGLPYSLEVFPFGSSHITHDIAMGLRITLEEAEKIKVSYGSVEPAAVLPKKPASRQGGTDFVYGNYSRRKLSEIIEARLSDIFELIEKHLKKVNRTGLLPAGVVLVGGGANLPGIEHFTKECLKVYARVAQPNNLGGFKEKVHNPAWSVAVGTALLALQKQSLLSPLLRGQTGPLFKWLRAFLP